MATLLPIPSEAPVMRTVYNESGEAGMIERLHTYLALDIELISAREEHDGWKAEQEKGGNCEDGPIIEDILCSHDEEKDGMWLSWK
jgi:hypothetical protein